MRIKLLVLAASLFIFLTLNAQAVSLTISHTDVRCFGGSDGTATANATGGIQPYTYSWSNGATTQTISNLTAGQYSCTVTGALGGTAQGSVTIAEPAAAISFTTSQTNILCNGAATGSATINVSGGTNPYTYNWSNGRTTATIINLTAGTYTCNITDANGCTINAGITITQPGAISFTTAQVNVSCNGGNDGSATVNVSGGTPPYTYNWFPVPNNGATNDNLSAGTYICTITDAGGCDTSATITITEPPALDAEISQTNVLCNGAATGSATVTVTGGTTPYSYNWSNGGTTAAINNLIIGTYTCTVTDAKGCDTTVSVTIVEPSAISFTPSKTDVLCNGAATGTASVNVSGGAGPYTYNWSNGATTPTVNNLTAGTYTCTITDANGCDTAATITITETGAITFATTQTDVKCNGDNTGSATVNVSDGGTAPYTYSWSPFGGTGATAAGLTAGTYTCTITDANGCDTAAGITITEPSAISVTTSQTNILCNGAATGIATVTVSGGTGAYTYNWLPYGGTGSTANNLIAGTYTCSITDANNCDTTVSITITQLQAITFTVSQINASCNGSPNGSATVNVSGGGTAPYIYRWSPSGGTAPTATGLSAGNYTCSITDANGCDTTVSFTITEPAVLSADATKTNISCNGANDGTATAIIGGGTPPYTYSWSPGGQTTATITNLGPGTYTCTATDADGCTITGTVSIVEPPLLTATSSVTGITCNGSNDGTATAIVSGGTPPYSYIWPNGDTTATADGLSPGAHICTITDANGCTTSTVAVINQVPPVTATASSANISCNGLSDGSASVNASGGTPPYTYLWSNGETTQNISNLSPGSYTVTVTDKNGCTFNVTGPAVVNEPAALSVTTSQTNVNCNGKPTGTATVNVTGGTTPYAYQWSPIGGTGATATGLPAGTYTCNITDANGCTISASVTITENSTLSVSFTKSDISCKGNNDGTITLNVSGGVSPYSYKWTPGGETTATINNLEPGTYTCVVTDANGCSAIETIEIIDPPLLKAQIGSFTDVSCNGASDGTATVNATGGTPPYSYSWLPSGGTGSAATNLPPGSYSCTVTDANGCTVTTSPVTITEQGAIDANVSYTFVSSCAVNDGTATANPGGGTLPYSYSWAPGGQTTATITGLGPGTYTCTVTDAAGCTNTGTITIPACDLWGTTVSKTDVTCNGLNNGTATVSATGGTPPYTYSWAPGGQTTSTITGLAPGVYTCIVADAGNNKDTVSVTINEPDPITAFVIIDTLTCNGDNAGSATVIPGGGTPPYTYLWSNGATTAKADNLVAGTYSCTITDAHGCTGLITDIVVSEPSPFSVVVSQTNVSCFGVPDGLASVTVSGGTGPYSYNWSPNGGSGRIATGLVPGTYTCLVTDANGCDTTISVTITEPAPLAATASKINISCHGADDGTATALITGGTAPYAYSWDPNGETTPTINNLSPGTYTATVTDSNGCTIIGTVEIMQPDVLKATTSVTAVTCNGDTDGIATANPTGGTKPYSYSWPNGDTSQTINNLAPGTYTCNVTDSNGCTTTTTATISEPAVVFAQTAKTNVSCNSGSNGSITLSGTGGTAPYTYSWDNGETGATINNLTAGTYTCTITDSHGCTGIVPVTITEPAALSVTLTQTNVSCSGNSDGIASLAVSGGTAPYTYNWSPRGGTGPIATGLSPGVYTCTITDQQGCTLLQNVRIIEPPVLTVRINQVNVSCKGAGDGTVTLTGIAGTPPYKYNWSTGDTTATIDNLSPGTYTFTIKDLHNCELIQTIEITEPNTLTATSGHTNVSCHNGNDGTATAVPAGGTIPYAYLWSPGGATTATASSLAAGTYTCTITDSNGCITTTSTTVTEPTALAVSVAHTNVSCNGAADGTASVSASGATAPYNYNWSNGSTSNSISNLSPGIYFCTIADNNGCDTTVLVLVTQPTVLSFTTSQTDVLCNGNTTGSATVTVSGGTGPYNYNWSNGGTTATINNLTAGTYTCTITDAHGCNTTASVIVTQPSAISFVALHTDISCNGGNTGTAAVITGGGTAPYTYLWSNGVTTATNKNLTAGTYTCTITDAHGCDTTATITILQPSAFNLNITQVNVDCKGNNTGSVSVATSGATPPYTYNWNNGGTAPVITNLIAGTYTCTITDANGCDTTISVTVTEPPVLTASITAKTNVLCNDDNTGSATVTPAGGTPPYSYSWSPGGSTDSVATGLGADIYICIITDAHGCTASAITTITQPPALAFTTSQVDVNCNGGNTGSASVTPGGGVAPYNYLWSNGEITPAINNLTAGTYTCTITDANGCDTTATITLTEASAITFSTTQTNVDCNGNNTGSATVTVSGGTLPYTYLWSNGETTATANDLIAGTYTCTITDANGCDTTATVTITEPDILSFTTSQTNVDCNGNNTGSATVTVSGGTSPYTYLWSNGGTTATIDNLTAGTYTCTITDAHGCDTTATVTITEPAGLSFTTSQTNVDCNGNNTGSATVTVSGGTSPYTYLWSNGGTTATIDDLTAGAYTCTITDAHGCDTTATVTITEPDILSFTTSQTNVDCNSNNTGSATVTVSGGTSPYTYLWSNSGTTATINNLTAGTYTCTITDAHGCDTTATVTITEPDILSFTTSQTNVDCNGNNTGSATVTVSGGTSPYTYLWSNGGTTATINNLTAGTYICTITDAHGCDTAATVTITEPAVLSFTTSQTNVDCNGNNTGSATVTVSGGTSPYTYLWSNGGTTATINNLTAGTYTCTITDAHGCDTTATITITEPDILSFTTSQTNVDCNGNNTGSATVTVSGGTSPYTYLWSNGGTTATINNLTAGTYTCTITDAHGCDTTATVIIIQPSVLTVAIGTQTNVSCNGGNDGSATVIPSGGTVPYSYSWSPSGGTGSTAAGLTAGIYTCTVTDGNGCSSAVAVTITEPDILSFTTSQTNVDCNGNNTGSATVTVSGGTSPYTYLWNNGGTTATINNLTAGTYTCTITDAHGCDTTATVTITEPAGLSFTTSQNNVDCNGNNTGSATVTVSGGTSPYTYLWSNGGTTATINNLTAGTYTCTITDAHGCDTTATVTITEPDILSFTTSQTNVDCNSNNTGSATVTVSGGTSPYTYLWSNGGTTATINNLTAGTYTCTITDAHDCDTTATVIIIQPSVLTVAIGTQTNVSCNGGNDGSATVIPSGGTVPYSYSWSPSGGTGSTAAGLTAGIYTCTVTDGNGCSSAVAVTITEPDILSFTTSQTNVDCNGNNTGSATVTVSGGTSPYTYLWSNGGTTATINNLIAGTYTCTITDAHDCDTTATVTITEPAGLSFTTSQTNVDCNSNNTGSATVTVSGGTSPYTYLWSNGGTTATINNLTAGTYTCTITDAHGCDTTATVTITEPAVLSFTTSQTNVDCNGNNTGSATVTVSGGTNPYTYLWSNSGTTATINNLIAGTYTCTITDAHGCDTTATVIIIQPSVLTVAIGTQTNVSCNGGNDGSATVIPSGGTVPYSYSWSPSGGTGSTAAGLTAGIYTCTVTDGNGCSSAVAVTITEPDILSFTTSQTNVDCNGNNTGSATVTVSGGTSPYTYLWSNGGTTATINNLTAGTYTCTITDAHGCDTTATVIIIQPSVLTVAIGTQTNVSCNGGNDGSATVIPSGGTVPYSYSWSPSGGTGSTAAGLTAGIYTCTVTDGNGCSSAVAVTITEPDILSFTTSQTNVDCNGNNTGSATVTVSGGTSPYTYLWSNGGTTATINNLIAGTYTCTITDAHDCDTTATVTITEPAGLSFTTSQTNVDCNGNNTGSATVTVSGGTSPYTYLWSNGGTTAIIDNLTAGTYTCTITDAHGCDTTATVTITEPAVLSFTTSQTNVDCNGNNTGSATVTVSGGTSPYTYLWSNGGTTATINNLTAGTYTCTITDAHGCDTTATVIIIQPSVLTVAIGTQTNVSCNGGNDGSATVIPSGGTVPYSYSWSPSGGTGSTAAGLTAGIYTCTVTDGNGCSSAVAVTITEPAGLSFTTSQTNVDCNGNNTGSATVTVSGGTSPYTYLWSNGGTTATINNLTAGTYTCTITDAHGCDTTATVTITEPDILSFTTSQTNVDCNGNNTGSATVTVSGGTSPYTYLWSNGGTTATINNLTAGTYTCTITDAHGCDTTVTVTITEPAVLSFTTSQTNVDCNGNNTGSATVTVSGGTSPYTYLWSNGGTTATINNLTAGTYTCTITDAHGCDTTATVTITEPAGLSFTTSQTNVDCNGNNTGSATVTVSGGTSPYTYLWNNGGTTATINNLTAGTYTCTITDAHGCDTTATVTITEPAGLSFTTSQTNVDCNGNNTGSATVTVSGGTSPYTYLWSNGGTTATIDNLTAGTYTCTTTDAHGCDTTATVIIIQPSVLTVAIGTQTNVSCNGGNDGSATVIPSGGTVPYSYSWSPSGGTGSTAAGLTAGIYTCTVTDGNGCSSAVAVTITEPAGLSFTTSQTNVDCNGNNTGSATVTVSGGTSPYTYLWSNGGTTATINNLTAGTYTCTITDAHGCDTAATVTITEPAGLSFTTSQTNVDCNGNNTGSATVTVSGGTSPYTYLWSNGGTTATINNLTAGTYTCTITDAHGCDTTVTVTITEPAVLSFTTSQTNVDCNGNNTGSATVTVSGGTSPYTYLWSNGGTTATINNLTAGTYICTITDAHGCDTAATVTITEPAVLSFTTSQTNVDCNGNNTGSATVTVSGGTSPYTYLWSNGGTTATINNLTAGTYTCTITDAHGCDTTATITITEPDILSFTTSQTNVDCNGNNTGSATVTVSGGTSPYTYLWSNGGTTATINNLTAGTYTCTITDAHGCDTTATVIIIQPSVLTVAIGTQTNVSCNGGNDGSATVIPSGGTVPYSYSWSPSGGTGSTAAGLTAGIYTCTVTDGNGCSSAVAVTITEPDILSFTTSQTNVDCNGNNTGSATVTVSGGTSPYTYLWNNGGTTATINNLTAGTYTCTITDAHGCDTTATVTITEPAGLSFTTSQNNVDCNGNNTGSATVTVSGGTSPYTYLWSNGGTTATINNLTAGTYTCTITDAHGCDTTATVTITEPDILSFTTSQTNVDCNSNNTGSATVTVSGGTSPYTYLWSNGGTTATINNLTAGTYTCTITDAHDCDTTATVIIIQPSVLTVAIGTQTNVSCNGGNDGSATVIPSGGTVPYSYSWSPSGGTGSTAAGLTAGIYTCTITDAHGCTAAANVTITEAPALAVTASQTNVNCNGGNTGSATVTVSGGTQPYTYLWSNGATTATVNNLAAGNYSCTITDAHGCDTVAGITITQPPVLAFAITYTNVPCNNAATGSATITPSGGTTPYTYLWSNGATTATINNLTTGTYACTITDANGCDTTATVTIIAAAVHLLISPQTSASCSDAATGSASVQASGGAPPYSYDWSNGATTPTVNNLAAGTYNVTITDANGCDTTVALNILAIGFTPFTTVTDANGNGFAEGNELLTYTIHVKNTGAVRIDSIIISDPVPLHTTFVSSAQGTISNNIVSFKDINLEINEERTYSFVVRTDQDIDSVKIFINVAHVKTNSTASACTKNPSVNIPVLPGERLPHDLSITKQSEQKPVTVGDTYEYTIVVLNTGSTAHPVVVTDTMPPQVTYISSIATTGTVNYNNNTRILTWQFDSLKDIRTESLTLRVRADEFGTVVNTATVTSPQEDIDPLNNSSANNKEVIPFKIPNVFTPNGDGRNETFFIKGLDLYAENELLIFNRWNANVYQKKNYQNDWDGSGLNEGTYFYILRLKDDEGKWHLYKGNVLILRH